MLTKGNFLRWEACFITIRTQRVHTLVRKGAVGKTPRYATVYSTNCVILSTLYEVNIQRQLYG